LQESGSDNPNASVQTNAGEVIDIDENLGNVDANSELASKDRSGKI